jgi:acyl-ACP thioesterase
MKTLWGNVDLLPVLVYHLYIKARRLIMIGYRVPLTVDIHDVDFNGIAKASSLMRYIQTAAQNQLTDNGMSYEQLRDKYKKGFILSKIKIEFNKTIHAYEKLTATTFPCHSRGYSFLRCYQLDTDSETVARAISVWALIDTDTRSLVRVNDFNYGLTEYDPLDMPIPRILMPKVMSKVGTYTVNYADLDQNKHMNNTHYPDVYANFLPLNKKRISTITISYLNEAVFGEKLSVYSAVEDGIYYIRTVRPDGKINSEAEITLCDV